MHVARTGHTYLQNWGLGGGEPGSGKPGVDGEDGLEAKKPVLSSSGIEMKSHGTGGTAVHISRCRGCCDRILAVKGN